MQKTRDNGAVKNLVKGGLTGVALFAALTVIVCALLLEFDLVRSTYLPLLMILSAFSGAVSGYSAVRKRRENGLVNGLAASVIPAFAVLVSMSVAYKGFSVFEAVIAACCLFGGGLGGVVCVNIRKKRKPIKKK